MLHRFGGASHEVVRSTELKYLPGTALTHLQSITQVGWKARDGGGYDTLPMPEIVFGYGDIKGLNDRVRFLDPKSAENLPQIDGTRYALIDYDGEGLPGVLTEQAGHGWFYKRPEGRDASGAGHFGAVRALGIRPASALAEGFQLQDINGDGVVDLVRVKSRPAGVFERRDDEWLAFRPFPSRPEIDWGDPRLRFADLDGDGFPDVLISDQDVFRWHSALARDGYGAEQRVHKPHERLEPMPLFATEREAVLLGDMTGDGLSDVVHVRNGSVSYWPNLGYGRFGQRVKMAGAPRLDTPEGFDPKRVRLGDVDGTGTSDLIYLGRDGVQVYLNQAGNSFIAQPVLTTLPPVDSLAELTVTDLWGTGTACLVWSTQLRNGSGRTLRWVDLLEGHKPYLLETVDNGFGQKTTLEHKASTEFYLQDRAAGQPWITKLPFPVQVLSRVTVEDLVSETKLVTTFQYHHGFYDGVEREFRGFGRVEQLDSESVKDLAGKGGYPRGLDETLHIPTRVTKTWFHTGAFLDASSLSGQYAIEYFPDGITALGDSVLAGSLLPTEQREARRALRGRQLRQEIYAQDGNDLPYVVTENNYLVRTEQARGQNRYAAFSVHARETLTHHLERNLGDPRIIHELVLRVGKYGDAQEKVSIAYPRAPVADRRPEQARLWATHTLVTTALDHDALDEDYRILVPYETVVSELVGLPSGGILSFDDVVKGAAAPEQPWATPDKRIAAARWLVRRSQARYFDDNAQAELAPGQAGVRALQSRLLTLALTRSFINDVWNGREAGVDALAATGGYLVEGDLFWAFAGTIHYDSTRFFLSDSMTNPFGGVSLVHYEAPHLLLPDWTKDPMGNQTQLTNDYRTLHPVAITDPNGTQQSVVTDPLGVVIATAVQGKAGEGGQLTTLDYAFYANPLSPAVVHTVAAQEFGGGTSEETWLYSDGSGREVQIKRRVEAGPEDVEDVQSPRLDPRYVGTGRTVFDNKGNAVKKYEPYFSGAPTFDHEAALVQQGVTPVLHYDPLNRLVRSDFPNGTYSKVELDAWVQETSDEIDTLDLTSPWYQARASGTFAREPQLEQSAATAALKLAQTPMRAHLDSLGRIFTTVRDGGASEPQRYFETSEELDIEGSVWSYTDPRFISGTQRLVYCRETYDIAGRRLLQDSVDQGRTWTLPDALGQAMYSWRANAGDPDALRLHIEYDAARRARAVWELPQGGAGELLREVTVYRDGPSAPARGAGRIFAELDGAGIVEYQYEFRGKPARVSRFVFADTRSVRDWSSDAGWDGTTPRPAVVRDEELAVTYGYDAMSRETARESFVGTRSGGALSRGYDRAGQLFSVNGQLPGRGAATAIVESVTYDPKGRRFNIAFGHGGSTQYHYDPFTGRMFTVATSKGNQLFQALAYAYDPVGNITAIRDDAQDTIYFNGAVRPERDYTYDAFYRLRSAVGREHLGQAAPDQRDVPDPLALPLADPNDLTKIVRFVEQFDYDPSGNLTSLSHSGATAWTRSYTIESASNRLVKTTVGGFDSVYQTDQRGNLRAMAHLGSMAWNHRDQLIGATRTRVGNTSDPAAATVASNPVSFAYDLRGERVVKQAWSAGKLRERIYLAGFEIYRERPSPDADATLERDTLHFLDDSRRVALAETLISGQNAGPGQVVRYQHDDHLGSAVLELDEGAVPLSYEEFHSYGTTALFAGLASKRYRYSGKERDEETGLGYHSARYLASWLGRWISADPMGHTVGVNGYAYASDNPLRRHDPGGTDDKDVKPAEPVPPPAPAKKPEIEYKGYEGVGGFRQILDAMGKIKYGMGPVPSAELESSKPKRTYDFATDPYTPKKAVGAWLDENKELIFAAAAKYKVDPLAIAGAIAWEAIENPHTGTLQIGKVKPRNIFSDSIAEQVEKMGILPKKTYEERVKLLRTPAGAIEYIGAILSVGKDVAKSHGLDIKDSPEMLTYFYQKHEKASFDKKLTSWEQAGKPKFQIPIGPGSMAGWVHFNTKFLFESLYGPVP
jgi:RHS repeat-associated protein